MNKKLIIFFFIPIQSCWYLDDIELTYPSLGTKRL